MGRKLRSPEQPGPRVEVVQSHPLHAAWIVNRMREADARECWLAARASPGQALGVGATRSHPHALTALLNQQPEAMFGVCPCDVEGRGSIWLLGTDEVTRHPVTLTWAARAWIPWFFERGGWRELGNYVHAENIVHVRWLEALGFERRRLIPDYGPAKTPFLEYVLPCASPS